MSSAYIDVKKLATLARINMTEEDISSFTSSIGAIIDYVSQLEEVALSSSGSDSIHDIKPVRNAWREDTNTIEPGMYTDSILKNAPASVDGFVKVKNIF